MGKQLNVGQALKIHLTESWSAGGEAWDEVAEERHNALVEKSSLLGWTLETFLRSDRDDQEQILENYFEDNLPAREVDRLVEAIRTIAGKPTAAKTPSDKRSPEYSRPAKRLAVYMHNNHPDLKGSTRAVVQMLLMHYNPVEGMFPSQDTLSELTGYSKGTISQACQAAVDADLLKVRKAYQYGKGKNEPYVYDFPAAVKKAIDLS